MESLLGQLLEESRTSGWAVGQLPARAPTRLLSASLLSREAEALGLVVAPNRVGDDPLSTLVPVDVDDAKPSSISAVVGMGEQPLHTDGAHLERVPDYVLLWCLEPNVTATRVWWPWDSISQEDDHGIFVVKSGPTTWLAPAVDSYRSLRFDPICMTPGDRAARQLATSLQSPPEDAVQSVVWDSAGKILLLCNRRVLHGRAAVADGDSSRRLERLAYYRTKS